MYKKRKLSLAEQNADIVTAKIWIAILAIANLAMLLSIVLS